MFLTRTGAPTLSSNTPARPGYRTEDLRFLFTVSVPALSVVTSADGGWDGALLVEADAGPVRSGEVHHRHQAVSIQRWETPNDARSIGGRGGWRISPLHLDDATQLSRMLRRYAGEEPGAYRRR